METIDEVQEDPRNRIISLVENNLVHCIEHVNKTANSINELVALLNKNNQEIEELKKWFTKKE